MRLRLGCAQLSSEVLCKSCGERVLDKQGFHALRCATGECTKGHNAVRDSLQAGFVASDPETATEVLGLAPSQPDLRQANILTTATRSSGAMAVDVGICVRHASGAGEDYVETMRVNKFSHYATVFDELCQQSIEYIPATFSCFGCRHPRVTTILSQASSMAARRGGFGNEKDFLRRWCKTIPTKIWQRAAIMIMACIPPQPAETQFLIDGSWWEYVRASDSLAKQQVEIRVDTRIACRNGWWTICDFKTCYLTWYVIAVVETTDKYLYIESLRCMHVCFSMVVAEEVSFLQLRTDLPAHMLSHFPSF